MSKKKKIQLESVKRFLSFVLLSLVLAISICAVGYVIFFRTVFARDIPSVLQENASLELSDTSSQVNSSKQLPKVAIIIDDLGYNKKRDIRFLAFPHVLTYSFLPSAPYAGKLEKIAFDSGKTVLLHLPLEPSGKKWNPGPKAIYLSDSPVEQRKKFEDALAYVPHATGVNNHMGSLFTTDSRAMARILTLIKEHGLFYIDSITTPDSKGFKIAGELGLYTAQRSVFLDNSQVETDICLQLKKLVKIAVLRGRAIGIGHPHHATYQALKHCIPLYVDRVLFVSVREMCRVSEVKTEN